MTLVTGYQPRKVRISMTPLIDVVFILLIFFMLTSSFIRDRMVSFSLPELPAGGSADMTVTDQDKANLLKISADGLTLNGQDVPLQEVIRHLKNFPGPELILVPGDNAGMKHLIRVVDELAKVPSLKVRMLPGDGGETAE